MAPRSVILIVCLGVFAGCFSTPPFAGRDGGGDGGAGDGGGGGGDGGGASGLPDGVDPSGLIALYRMDLLAGGETASDLGTHPASCLGGECPAMVSGHRDGGLDFDGVDDVLRIASDPAFEIAAGTIAAWVRPENQSGTYGGLITKPGGLDTSGDSWALFSQQAGPSLDLLGVFGVDYRQVGDLPPNQWHHVAATWNAGVAKLYVAGEEVATFAVTLNYDLSLDVLMGADDDGGLAWYFGGIIDDVVLFERALDPSEITALAGG